MHGLFLKKTLYSLTDAHLIVENFPSLYSSQSIHLLNAMRGKRMRVYTSLFLKNLLLLVLTEMRFQAVRCLLFKLACTHKCTYRKGSFDRARRRYTKRKTPELTKGMCSFTSISCRKLFSTFFVFSVICAKCTVQLFNLKNVRSFFQWKLIFLIHQACTVRGVD